MATGGVSGTGVPNVAHPNHGRTRAAWVANISTIVGALAAGVGIAVPWTPLVWVGAGVVLVGLLAGAVLKALGHGQPKH